MLTKTAKRDLPGLLRWLETTPPDDRRDAESEIYESCFELSEAARRLERAAGRPGSGAAAAATLGGLTEAFDALANTLIMIGDEFEANHRRREGIARSRTDRLRALLHTGSQNLRYAQASANSARAVAGSISGAR